MSGKRLRHTQHLDERLALRLIPQGLPERILSQAERTFLDTTTAYRIAVARVQYRGRDRLMMAAYEETEDEIVIVTVHPLDERDVEAKIRNGRWIHEP